MTETTLIDAAKLKDNVHHLAERLATGPDAGIVRPKVVTRLLRDMVAESHFVQYDKPFSFKCDEAVERAGLGQQPSPMRYFLSGIAFCLQVWYAKGAALVDCKLDGLEIDLQTFMDMRGEHLVDGVPPNPQYMTIEARVSSPSSADVVLKMAAEANRRCPLYNLVALAIPIHERIILNGKTIRNTLPAGLS